MSCNIGIHRAIEKVLNNKPWFKYKQGDDVIEILDSPNEKISKETSIGVASSVSKAINKAINNGSKKIGDITYSEFNSNSRGIVKINPTNKQLDLLNTIEEEKILALQKEVDDEIQQKEFEKLQDESNTYLNDNGDIVNKSDLILNKINEYFSENIEPLDITNRYGKVHNVKSLLSTINKSEIANKHMKKLAGFLENFSTINNVKIEFYNNKEEFLKGYNNNVDPQGYYLPIENVIKILDDRNVPEGKIDSFLIHEILHALSWHNLRNPNASFSKDFQEYYNYASKYFPPYDAKTKTGTYATSTIDEFFVALFTDPKFIKSLEEIPPLNKEYKNLFEEIFDNILKALGITKKQDFYQEAFSLATNVLQEAKDITESISDINQFIDNSLYDNNPVASPVSKIKPGVQELFDSNPDLAQSVYEALGFNRFNFKSTDKYLNQSFNLDKKEEVKLFLQSLEGKKIFSPTEMLARISNAQTSEINKGLADYLNSILEKYQGIYVNEIENSYRIEFKENLQLSNKEESGSFASLGGFNRVGKKFINLTGREGRDLISIILHEFSHDIEPYVLNKDKTIFPSVKGFKNPLTEKQKELGIKLEELRKFTITYLAEDFKKNRISKLKKDIVDYENGKLLPDGYPASKIYIENLKLEIEKTKKVIENNEVEKYIEKSNNIFFYRSHYGLSNLNEFITESLTSETFREVLNNIPYKNTTLLSYLFELFQKIIGVKKDTILSESLNLIHELATTEREQLRDFEITPQQKQQAISLYSQYLDSLNKPNTNPLLQGNQKEQVKKFAELQERFNNKEFIEDTRFTYENSEGLQKNGTQEEYNDYIARVSLGILKNPSSGEYNYTSQVKDIVYHDGEHGKIKEEGFRKDLIGISDGGVLGNGFSFYFETMTKEKQGEDIGLDSNDFVDKQEFEEGNLKEKEEHNKTALIKILFNNKTSGEFTAKEILDNILTNFPISDMLNRVALNMLEKSNAKIKFVNKSQLKTPTTFMQYNHQTGYIEVCLDTLGKTDTIEEGVANFLHEVFHNLTVDVLTKPKTTEEIALNNRIKVLYNALINDPQAKTMFEHELSNIYEFTAGFLNNEQFRTYIEDLHSNHSEGLFQKIINFIKSIIGLDSRYDQFVKDIVTLSNTDLTNRNFGESRLVLESRFEAFTKHGKESVPIIDNLITKTYKRIQNISNVLKIQEGKEDYKEKTKKVLNQFDRLLKSKEVKELEELEKWKLLLESVKYMQGSVKALDKTLDDYNEDPDLFDIRENYDFLEGTLNNVRAVNETLVEFENLKSNKEFMKMVEEDESILDFGVFYNMQKDLTVLDNKFLQLVKKKVKNFEWIINHFQKTWAGKYESRFLTELKSINPKATKSEKDEYINKQTAIFRNEIADRANKDVQELVDGIKTVEDISQIAAWINDGRSLNNSVIQMFMTYLLDLPRKINNLFGRSLQETNNLYQKYYKGATITSNDSRFKKFISKSQDGFTYIRGDYKVEFKDELNKRNQARYKAKYPVINFLNDQLAIQTKFELLSRKSSERDIKFAYGLLEDIDKNLIKKQYEEYLKLDKEYTTWKNSNTILIEELDENDEIIQKRIPSNKWKDDLKDLSTKDKEFLKEYKNLLHESQKNYTSRNQLYNKSSLIKEVQNVEYTRLPSMEETTLNKLKNGKGFEGLKQSIKEFGSKRPDDIIEGETVTDKDGNVIKDENLYVYTDLSGKQQAKVPVHYRNKVDSQSLDLFSLLAMEQNNAISYKQRRDVQSEYEMALFMLDKTMKINKSHGLYGYIKSTFNKKGSPVEFDFETSTIRDFLTRKAEAIIYGKFQTEMPKIGNIDTGKIINNINYLTGIVAMTLKPFSAAVNFGTGLINNTLEFIGNEKLSKEDAEGATRFMKLFSDPSIYSDIGRSVDTSLPNLIMNEFRVLDGHMVKAAFEKGSRLANLFNWGSLQFMHGLGEYANQSMLTFTILNSIKILDKDGNYLDKTGKITDYKNAANLLTIFYKDPVTNKLETYLPKDNFYTTLDLQNTYEKSGERSVYAYVKTKLFRTQGNYDSQEQPEIARSPIGKGLLMFKKHLIDPYLNRFRGFVTLGERDVDKLVENDRLKFNTAIRKVDEGYYITTLRFLYHEVIKNYKTGIIEASKKGWNNLEDYEKAAIRRSLSEALLTTTLILTYTILASGADDEDDDSTWIALYLLKRLDSDLSTYQPFRNIDEAWRVIKNPYAPLRSMEDTQTLIGTIMPWNWGSILDEDSKGNNKAIKNLIKATPLNFTTQDAEKSVKFLMRQDNELDLLKDE